MSIHNEKVLLYIFPVTLVLIFNARVCFPETALLYLSVIAKKERDLTQSPTPTETQNSKVTNINATKMFDYTTTADRLRTISGI